MNKIIKIILFLIVVNQSFSQNEILKEAYSYTLKYYFAEPLLQKDFFKDSTKIIKINGPGLGVVKDYTEYFHNKRLSKSNVSLDTIPYNMLFILRNETVNDTIALDLRSDNAYFRNNTYYIDKDFFFLFASIIPRSIFDYYIKYEMLHSPLDKN